MRRASSMPMTCELWRRGTSEDSHTHSRPWMICIYHVFNHLSSSVVFVRNLVRVFFDRVAACPTAPDDWASGSQLPRGEVRTAPPHGPARNGARGLSASQTRHPPSQAVESRRARFADCELA